MSGTFSPEYVIARSLSQCHVSSALSGVVQPCLQKFPPVQVLVLLTRPIEALTYWLGLCFRLRVRPSFLLGSPVFLYRGFGASDCGLSEMDFLPSHADSLPQTDRCPVSSEIRAQSEPAK